MNAQREVARPGANADRHAVNAPENSRTRAEHARSSASAEDLAHGQIVIVTARWVLVLSALLVALWSPGNIGELRIEIVAIISLAVANFYLHAQLLSRRRQTLDERVVYAASLGDLAVITAIVATQGGYASTLYVFYYPAVLAFSVAFPRAINLVYTGASIAAYAAIALATADLTQQALSVIFVRVLMIAAVGAGGNLYWRIERDRREAAASTQQALLSP